ncbi:MAG: microcystin-dependent protein [Yoonia sp.]|jgi:microcystin-dependent protein
MIYLKKATNRAIPALAFAMACLATPNLALADSQPFIGEIAPTGVNGFCPRGWAETNGQLLAILNNEALFSLLGSSFGGDRRTTFGLPDLRGRHPIGVGSGPGLQPRTWGQKNGVETVYLNTEQLANHSHLVNATNADGDKAGPGDKILAAAPNNGTGTETIYSDQAPNRQMSYQMIALTGSSLPIAVVDPAMVIRYCIAIYGTYPSRN